MTKKFSFELESVLNIKKFRQQLLKQDLAKLLESLYREQGQLSMMEEALKEAKQQFREDTFTQFSSSQAQSYKHYLRYTAFRITEQRKKVETIEEVIGERREQIREAEKEKKVLEKLRARKKKEFNKKLNLKFQKATDEVALQRFVRGDKAFDGSFITN